MAFKISNFTYKPGQKEPFRLSRSKIDLFLNCPRCFWMDRRLGIGRPADFPLNLNNAVDLLLKKEFDQYRAAAAPHPLMLKNRLNAVPFRHERMEEWRDAFKRGITYLHPETNLVVGGGVDDVWQDENGDLHIVDYKSTAKEGDVNLDAEWQIAYKRQVEFYQWLFRKNGFPVSDTAYFVYANGKLDRESFDNKIEFDLTLIPYEGNDAWVEEAVRAAHACLNAAEIPAAAPSCDYCAYRLAAARNA